MTYVAHRLCREAGTPHVAKYRKANRHNYTYKYIQQEISIKYRTSNQRWAKYSDLVLE